MPISLRSLTVEAPLNGIGILDLTRLFPGAYASQQLQRLGAEVIRVESPEGGDWLRDLPIIFSALNRDKLSMAIDLKNPEGKSAFLRLAKNSDVLFESFRPGVMEKLGLGFEQLTAINPDLVYCRLNGYGNQGPYAERAGHDLNYAALSGVLAATGTANGNLAIPAIQVGDLAGATNAVTAIVAALFKREKTRKACLVEISMFDGLLSWLTPQIAASMERAEVEPPGLGWLTGGEPCYHLYRCADGWMSVAAIEPKFWSLLLDVLGLPELADSAHTQGADGIEVMDQIGTVFLQKTRDGWLKEFSGMDVCCEPVLTFVEAANQPLATDRHLFVAPNDVAAPIRIDGYIAHSAGAAPTLGEHTDKVLRAADFSPPRSRSSERRALSLNS